MEKVTEFDGNYWWDDAENVISVLKKEIGEALSEVRVGSIKITGTDFNDGKKNRTIEINVNCVDNKIVVEKNYS